jgi:hypothetical protein
MRVLFDQGTPVPLRRYLPDHSVTTVYENGWSTLENGALLRAAEREGFEILVTTDQKIRHQQNLDRYNLAIVVLMTTSWPILQQHTDRIAAVISRVAAGQIVEIVL